MSLPKQTNMITKMVGVLSTVATSHEGRARKVTLQTTEARVRRALVLSPKFTMDRDKVLMHSYRATDG